MIMIKKTQFIDACEEEDIEYRTDYSGRYMFGNLCVAVVGSAVDLMRFGLRVLPQLEMLDGPKREEGDPPLIAEEWFDMRWDSMARDMVFYWPGVQVFDDAAEVTD